MNGKAFAILNPRSFVGIFSDYGCENTETSVSLTDSDVLSQKGKKTEVRPEKPKVTYSVALATGAFATGRFWLCTWQFYSVGKDKVNNWQFCILRITVIFFFFFGTIQRMSLSWANALVGFYPGTVDPIISFINKFDFNTVFEC